MMGTKYDCNLGQKVTKYKCNGGHLGPNMIAIAVSKGTK